jgi:glucose-1-phosphate adenylyltransferase
MNVLELLIYSICRHVLTQENTHELHHYLADRYPSRPLQLVPHNLTFVRALPCFQKPHRKHAHLGSADAVPSALERIRWTQQGSPPIEEVLFVSGQNLYSVDFQELLGFHRDRGADITVVTRQKCLSNSQNMGLCRLSSNHQRIEKFNNTSCQKPISELVEGSNCELEVSLGMYVFKRSVLESMLESDMTQGIGSISEDIISPAVKGGLHVTTFKHDGLFTVRSIAAGFMFLLSLASCSWHLCSSAYLQNVIDLFFLVSARGFSF